MNQIGFKCIYLDVVDSTINYVANLIKTDGIEHGTVILADEQTNGRGQRGTIWQTQPGMNLIFTVFVEFKDFTIAKNETIHHWVALSVHDTLLKLGISNAIKWPNDIITENGKIAGILIENTIAGSSIKHSIVGIGLNVNQIEFPELKATSVRLETGIISNVKEISFMLCAALNARWKSIENNDFSTLKQTYLSKLWGMGKEVKFIRSNQSIIELGTILGTNDLGALEVETPNGVETFDLKEIKFLVD